MLQRPPEPSQTPIAGRALMRYLSVCSGIEAASVAWEPLGWLPVAFAEIDPFPCAVLAHHWPAVPNWGDITKHENWPNAAIDVLVGGTPCQDFSVAGARAGLAGDRGQFTLAFLEIARRYRPQWLVWENVAGALSLNGGRDFGAVLGRLAELGYGFAYRILDAQFFGLAQRRQRVFVVGYLGDWRPPAAVLFERESLSGHPAPRRAAGQAVAGALTTGASSGGGWRVSGDGAAAGHLVANTLHAQRSPRMDPGIDTLVAHTLRGEGFDASEDGTGRGTPLVPVAYDLTQITHPENRANPKPDDPAPTLLRTGHPLALAFDARQSDVCVYGDQTGALDTKQPGPAIVSGMAVRRITPREAERLQGLPDDHTAIRHRGKPAADGPRYRAIGNSMAVPVIQWLGRRITLANQLMAKQLLRTAS